MTTRRKRECHHIFYASDCLSYPLEPGEQQIGGLVITLGPPTHPPSSQELGKPLSSSSRTHHPSRPLSSQSQRPLTSIPSTSSSQPSQHTKLNNHLSTSTHARSKSKGKERELPAVNADGDTDVEEDVRRMNVEAEDLRRQSHIRKASLTSNQLSAEFRFPPPPATTEKSRQQQHLRDDSGKRSHDTVQRIPERETPQIHKNKVFRGERPSAKPGATTSSIFNSDPMHPETPGRRRSSMGTRGKRISSCFDSGVISMFRSHVFLVPKLMCVLVYSASSHFRPKFIFIQAY